MSGCILRRHNQDEIMAYKFLVSMLYGQDLRIFKVNQ